MESLQVGFGFVRRLDDFKVRSLRVTARFIRRQGKLRFQLVAMVVKFLDGHESSMGTLIFKVSPVNPVKTCTPLDLFWGSRIMSGKVSESPPTWVDWIDRLLTLHPKLLGLKVLCAPCVRVVCSRSLCVSSSNVHGLPSASHFNRFNCRDY